MKYFAMVAALLAACTSDNADRVDVGPSTPNDSSQGTCYRIEPFGGGADAWVVRYKRRGDVFFRDAHKANDLREYELCSLNPLLFLEEYGGTRDAAKAFVLSEIEGSGGIDAYESREKAKSEDCAEHVRKSKEAEREKREREAQKNAPKPEAIEFCPMEDK